MSAILSVDDLNDFISPGVACIKPIETLPAAPQSQPSNETEVILDGQHPSTLSPNKPAEISLTDCLACSGCVTSAEAVLVSLQSHAEVLSVLDSAPALKILGPDAAGKFTVQGLDNPNAKLFVASVSPQSRANLAASCGGNVSEAEAGRMIQSLLNSSSGLPAGGRWNNGFTWVCDTNAAREACLVLSADEVLSPHDNKANSAPTQPILAASCPGWVCYAEKTHPHVLPHLSKVKSPQALMGTLLKTTLSRILDIPPDRIWHLAVMPCFDKKLEASREELTDEVWGGSGQPGRGVRDVDCVITSKEVLMLAESRGLNFFDLFSQSAQTSIPFPDPKLHSFLFPPSKLKPARDAGSSGGLLYHVLQTKAAQVPGSKIQVTRGRNADVVDYSILVNEEPVFRAARYYGFRNIQNLVRRLKPARPSRMPGGKPFGSARRPVGKSASLEYSYVEVMACPGGCINGGGQIKVDDPIIIQRKGLEGNPGPEDQKQWLADVDEAYFSADETRSGSESIKDPTDTIGGISPSYIHDTLAYWSQRTGVELEKLVLTTYREVISDVGKDTTTDAEKVIQLAGKIGGGW